MRIGLIASPEDKQNRMLFVYNIYRIISIVILIAMYLFGIKSQSSAEYFIYVLIPYVLFAGLSFIFGQRHWMKFETQALVSGIIDVISISIMLIIIGDLYISYGILLNITIAYLSIMIPGRIAIFFASLATCLLLFGILMGFLEGSHHDITVFFYSGVYGAGFFATSLTAWYLANRVSISERLALVRTEELASMQKINEYIVDRLQSGIIYADENKHIKLMNTAAKKFFNVKKNDNPQQLDELSKELSDKFNKFTRKTQRIDTVAQAFLQNPNLRIHFFSADLVKNPAVLITLDDMTFISQQAQQLKLASLGRFSASIAHELRNPLGAIFHAIQLLGDTAPLDSADERLKQLIKNNCERMNGVIKNVLQLTRRQQSQPQLIDIGMFLIKFREDFLHSNPDECNIVIKFPKSAPYMVVFDESQLEQALFILCDNALKHGHKLGEKVKVVVSVKAQGNKTILTVSDSGPGISEEYHEAIFEPFFSTLSNSTGMGLFIARDLCEINQAQLRLVKSAKGASFAITINPSDELLL